MENLSSLISSLLGFGLIIGSYVFVVLGGYGVVGLYYQYGNFPKSIWIGEFLPIGGISVVGGWGIYTSGKYILDTTITGDWSKFSGYFDVVWYIALGIHILFLGALIYIYIDSAPQRKKAKDQ